MKYVALLVLVACSSGSKRDRAPGEQASAVENANDPWATPATPNTAAGPAAKNLNKLVIGGDNTKPQMGLFALSPPDAKRVDAAMRDDYEKAYRLAQKLAVRAWAGDRNFCEDAVRQTIGFFGIDGMLDEDALRKWRTAKLADVRKEYSRPINELHFQMIGERDEAACDHTLAIYVEGLQVAANDKLELRNFGY
ncbi:MAG TPA: hypothetical protein VIV40_19765 [Kofleriaceae bacterium]